MKIEIKPFRYVNGVLLASGALQPWALVLTPCKNILNLGGIDMPVI
jgi:hypothetical protein